MSFPRYDGFFGKLVARFLNGDFGPLESVDPHFSALLYAEDRREAIPTLESDLAAGRTLLADRYIASNLAHQGARVPREKRDEFLAWLKQLEYRVYALPTEDLVIYLRVPAAEAHRLVGRKGRTRLHRAAPRPAGIGFGASRKPPPMFTMSWRRQPNWLKIECFDVQARALRSPEAIHKEILAAIEARVFPALHAGR